VPVPKRPGDDVFAGTINQGGALVVASRSDAGETMLARIIRLVEEAREQRAPAQHFIDRFAHPYTLGRRRGHGARRDAAAAAVDAAWGDAFYRAMTLLVVASPCALVISTPSAILSGIANGARHGILFKGGAYLDLAGTIDTVAFDKTGTLTSAGRAARARHHGRAAGGGPRPASSWRGRRTRMTPMPRCSPGRRRRAPLGAPPRPRRARGGARAASRRADVPSFVAFPGEGVQGHVDGETAWVGNAAMAQRMNAPSAALLRGWIAEQTSLGRSVVYVGHGRRVLGAMSFGDALKPNAAATVRHLKYEGIRWITCCPATTRTRCAPSPRSSAPTRCGPGCCRTRRWRRCGQLVQSSRGVAMVGDGVNDAPAMAAATLGIAMGAAGTDVAIETADVVLMSDDIEKVDYVIHLGKRARRVVRQNVYFSVGWMLCSSSSR
jgi:Zn2+/Cd2+-exporting ATPase